MYLRSSKSRFSRIEKHLLGKFLVKISSFCTRSDKKNFYLEISFKNLIMLSKIVN